MSNVIFFPAPMEIAALRDKHRLEETFRQGLFGRIMERLRFRKMLRQELRFQPDSVLADWGWTRAEMLREVQKPFWRA